MKKPSISCVMCCYNAEQHIKFTIESILNQSFNDFEFIIWNDGSDDGTGDIIKSYSDPRIRYFEDSNKGEGEAARLACLEAQGKYIARIDADDICLPQRFEKEYAFLESHPDYVLVSSAFSYIDSEGKYIGRAFPITNSNILQKQIVRNNYFVHSSSMYRSDAYRNVGGYKNIRLFQDHLLFRNLSTIGKIAILEDVLIQYRVLGCSVAHVIDNSPYRAIIDSYKCKILQDDGNNTDDILLFNQLYALARKNVIVNNDISDAMKDIQNQIYNCMANVLGRKLSAKILVKIKNAIASLKSI